HGQVEGKAAQHIIVEDGWETKIEQAPAPGQPMGHVFAKRRAGRLTVPRQRWQAGRRRREARSLEPWNSEPWNSEPGNSEPGNSEPGAERGQLDRAAFRLPEQKNSSHK